jgi:hypothetical protein
MARDDSGRSVHRANYIFSLPITSALAAKNDDVQSIGKRIYKEKAVHCLSLAVIFNMI